MVSSAVERGIADHQELQHLADVRGNSEKTYRTNPDHERHVIDTLAGELRLLGVVNIPEFIAQIRTGSLEGYDQIHRILTRFSRLGEKAQPLDGYWRPHPETFIMPRDVESLHALSTGAVVAGLPHEDVRVMDPQSGAVLTTFPYGKHRSHYRVLGVTPADDVIIAAYEAGGNAPYVIIWEPKTGSSVEHPAARNISLQPSGDSFFYRADTNSVYLISDASGISAKHEYGVLDLASGAWGWEWFDRNIFGFLDTIAGVYADGRLLVEWNKNHEFSLAHISNPMGWLNYNVRSAGRVTQLANDGVVFCAKNDVLGFVHPFRSFEAHREVTSFFVSSDLPAMVTVRGFHPDEYPTVVVADTQGEDGLLRAVDFDTQDVPWSGSFDVDGDGPLDMTITASGELVISSGRLVSVFAPAE